MRTPRPVPHRPLALLSALLLPALLVAQDAAVRINDHQTWGGLGLSYSPFKRTTLSAKYVCRTYGLLEQFKGSYYYLQARRRIDKHWSVDAQVRVMDSHRMDYYRLEGGIRYRARHHGHTWYTRTAFFNERPQLSFGEAMYRPATTYWRQRVYYAHDVVKKVQLEVSAETWVRLNGPAVELDRAAFIGALLFDLPDGWELSTGYLVQPEYAAAQPKSLYAAIVTLNLDLDRALDKGKKKKKNRKKGGKAGNGNEGDTVP